MNNESVVRQILVLRNEDDQVVGGIVARGATPLIVWVKKGSWEFVMQALEKAGIDIPPQAPTDEFALWAWVNDEEGARHQLAPFWLFGPYAGRVAL